MKQNKSAKLLSYSFNKIDSKNDPPEPLDPKSAICLRFAWIFQWQLRFLMFLRSPRKGLGSKTCQVSLLKVFSIGWNYLRWYALWKITGKLYENYRKIIKAVVGHSWGISVVKMWKRIAQKLRRIILLHFVLVTFRFLYGRTLKPLISLFSNSGRVNDSQNQYYLSLETPGHPK